MSSKTTGLIWDMVLSAPQRLVLLAMADHATHDGDHIHAPIPYIAWKTGYSARNTARIIDDLIGAGLLILTKQGLGESNEYRFDFSRATFKPNYKGRKPKKPSPTHDKMSGVKKHTHDKMSGVAPQKGPTHANLSPPHDNMAWDTHDKLAIDHDQYHLESDLDLSPPTTNNTNHAGGGGDFDRAIASLFRDYHIGQSRKLARLYRAEYPDVTIDQLRLACEQRFDRTIPPDIAGGRLYLALQDGLPTALPPGDTNAEQSRSQSNGSRPAHPADPGRNGAGRSNGRADRAGPARAPRPGERAYYRRPGGTGADGPADGE